MLAKRPGEIEKTNGYRGPQLDDSARALRRRSISASPGRLEDGTGKRPFNEIALLRLTLDPVTLRALNIDRIITMASRGVRIPFLAFERSLRAVGCDLPLLVIPYGNDLFDLPPMAVLRTAQDNAQLTK
jgi:hypothetical protein